MRDWLIPTAVFVGGQASAVMFTWLQARWRWNRERDARRDERRERLVERHNETLVRLQESLYGLGLQSYFLAQVRWESAEHERYSEDERLETFARAGVLRVRVVDPDVRRLAQEVRDDANAVFRAKSFEEAQEALTRQHGAYERANERIGELVRAELERVSEPTSGAKPLSGRF